MQMKKRINSLSGGLVEVKLHPKIHDDESDEPTVQFIHQSVNDFLEKDKFQCLLVDSSLNAIVLGHDQLARSYINFLKHHRTLLAQLVRQS